MRVNIILESGKRKQIEATIETSSIKPSETIPVHISCLTCGSDNEELTITPVRNSATTRNWLNKHNKRAKEEDFIVLCPNCLKESGIKH